MNSVLKIPMKLSPEDSAIINGQSRICNWAYNHLLEIAMSERHKFISSNDKEAAKLVYSKRGLRNLLPQLKKDFTFLQSVHSSPLKNTALRLSATIEAYQKSRKGSRKGKKTGWPKFRSWNQKYFSLLYDEPKKGFKVSGKTLTLSLGKNRDGKRLKVSGELVVSPAKFHQAEIKQLRITKDHGRYYAIFTIKRPEPALQPVEKVIALDPNHKNLAYGVGSDGIAIEIHNPWFLKVRQRRIDHLKSRRDRCRRKSVKKTAESGKAYWLPSRRWSKYQGKLEIEYSKRREQTKSYLYTVCNFLCKNYDFISVGDYTPKGGGINTPMRRAMNNESLIGRFKETLQWVAKKSGKISDIWPERNTTKTCSHCGYQVDGGLSPAIREWTCQGCQVHHIRDENAAKNGLKYVYSKHKFPCSGRLSLEIKERWALRFDGLGLISMNRGLLAGL